MLEFITLTESDGRNVSFAYTDKEPTTCNLLGVLPHQTEFMRSDLLQFAHDVIKAFEKGGKVKC